MSSAVGCGLWAVGCRLRAQGFHLPTPNLDVSAEADLRADGMSGLGNVEKHLGSRSTYRGWKPAAGGW
jgi:hypothetical protein